ncbi:ROK family protein [Nocardioides sp. GCM10027113]|uniref:ROK family transcriptional regulator n=1 Tax=unclassified Nocardioides TaxID=2615069 RepID=UPI00360DD84B
MPPMSDPVDAPAPGSTSSLRAANQRRVVEVLQRSEDRRPVSQADIARATRLAPATVSNIVRELSGAGMVETTVVGGRRGTMVRIAREAGYVAGIDFGHRHLRVAVGDLSGEIHAVEREPIAPDHPHEDGLALAGEMLDRLAAQVGTERSAIAHVGLGLPTPLDRDGLVMSAAILPGWVGVDAHREAERVLGRPTTIENDANLGALAEHRWGAGRGHATMAYVKVSSGVGAGLVIDGQIFRGAFGTAGELGHLTIDEQGPFCRCGSRGCLEAYASVGMAQEALADQMPGAGVDDLVAAARQGAMGPLRVFEDAGLRLGWGLAMLANLLNPSCVVVGGDMSRAGDLLLDPVRVGLRRHALASVSAATEVRLASLGDRASVIGAVMLALDSTELIPATGVG